MIAVLTQEQVIEKVERSVFFHPTPKTTEMSDEFLAQIIRRATYVMAPCLQHELIRAVTQSLEGLGCDELDERVERLTDDLIAWRYPRDVRRTIRYGAQAVGFRSSSSTTVVCGAS
jgi:hypothetical protein